MRPQTIAAKGGREVPEHSMITFAEHQVRAGKAGAYRDFEQMLGLLARATSGREANLVFANPGDWGIDVLVGDLNGRVTVWQAKYFSQGVTHKQRPQIKDSFTTVMARAAENGFTVERWVLCIPASMDTLTTQWWETWKAEQELNHPGLVIDLWDENKLRELLLRPEAADVYQHFYGRGRHLAWFTPKRAITGGVGLGLAGGLVAVGIWLLVPGSGNGGNSAAGRTAQQWAAQVNAVCQAMNPTLIADLTRAEHLPASAFWFPMNPQVPKAFDQLNADYTKQAARIHAVAQPSTPDALVNQWLLDYGNRGNTLFKADQAIDNINGNLLERLPSAADLYDFVSQTNGMQSLSTQVGVPACQ